MKTLSKINEIMINSKLSVVVEKEKNSLTEDYGVALQKTLMKYGFVASPELTETMLSLTHENFINELKNIEHNLQIMTGSDVEHKPMYVNFPSSVLEKTDLELLVDQLLGYYADFYDLCLDTITDSAKGDLRRKIAFDGEKKERVKLKDKIEYKVLNLASVEDFEKFITSLMASKVDLTPLNKSYLEWALENYDNVESLIPDNIPFKENLVLIANKAIKLGFNIEKMPLKTGTDVLRLAVAMSNGDITLSESTRFRKFSRPEKRFLLTALNKVNYQTLVEDILRRKEQFKKLVYGLDLFSKESKNKYKQLYEVMEAVYNHKHLETYRNKLAFALAEKDTKTCVKLLSQRPGEFARTLDKVLRDANDKEYVLNEFEKVANKVATPTLWKLKYYFENRNDEGNITVMPKGLSSKIVEYENNKAKLDDTICEKACEIISTAINSVYQEKEKMGAVYLDESLKQFLIPTSNRTANAGLNVYTRGSVLKLKDSNTYRFFLHWKGNDVDLSCSLLDDSLEMIDNVSFTNLRGRNLWGYHSGDITYAPKGASEFIDFDINKIKDVFPNAKYLCMYVYSYSLVPFSKIENCFAGIMERENLNSGEIFEPSTVKIKSVFTSNSLSVCPAIVDLDTKELYWADINITNYFHSYCGHLTQQVETTLSKGQLTVKMIVGLKNKLPSVYDVLKANIEARGGIFVSKVNELGYLDDNGVVYKDEEVTKFINPDFAELTEKYL